MYHHVKYGSGYNKNEGQESILTFPTHEPKTKS